MKIIKVEYKGLKDLRERIMDLVFGRKDHSEDITVELNEEDFNQCNLDLKNRVVFEDKEEGTWVTGRKLHLKVV